MAFDKNQRADIVAMRKFPSVEFDGSKDDFGRFSRSLHRRISSYRGPSGGGLKHLHPLRLEAAIHRIYAGYCFAKGEFDRECRLARNIMQTPPEKIVALSPGLFGSIDWARMRLLTEGKKYG